MFWNFLENLLPNETYYVENIKSTNFILGTNTKSMNLWIHKLVILNQNMKIYAHEEKYSNLYYYCMHLIICKNGRTYKTVEEINGVWAIKVTVARKSYSKCLFTF
jgi:hypothetical protein